MLLASCSGGDSSGGGVVENPAPISCPSGFIPVPHNTEVGTTKDFCVMKYEAKAYHSVNQTIDADGCYEEACTTPNWGLEDHIPASSPTGSPWRRIDATNALAECNSLNTGGATNYDLISNPEWMTIARNAESVSSNWSTGTVGTGVMARGWAANTSALPVDPWQNTAVAPSTDANCLYNTGQNTCASSGDHLYRRTLTLSNGEVIWDLSGNVSEWVDWETGGAFTTVPQEYKAFVNADAGAVAAWREFTSLDQNINNGDVMNPLTWQSSNPALDSSHGIGQYYAGASGGAALRGGGWFAGSRAGAFTLNLNSSTSDTNTNVGFRCVYRP